MSLKNLKVKISDVSQKFKSENVSKVENQIFSKVLKIGVKQVGQFQELTNFYLYNCRYIFILVENTHRVKLIT